MSYENPVNPHATDATPKRPMNETPLTREQVAALLADVGRITLDDCRRLCHTVELLRARLEEAEVRLHNLYGAAEQAAHERERAEQAERDIADARADWTKQRHHAEKAERELGAARRVTDEACMAAAEHKARIRVLEDALSLLVQCVDVDPSTINLVTREEWLTRARAALSHDPEVNT